MLHDVLSVTVSVGFAESVRRVRRERRANRERR
jgi:hypothetical protein